MASAPDSPLGAASAGSASCRSSPCDSLPTWWGSNAYLSQIERGLREPSEKVLDAIAGNLELSTDGLYDQGARRRGEEEGDGRNRSWWRRFAPIPI